MQKFITTHRFRVKRAKEAEKSSPEKLSFCDRKAFVKFYLLEDIVRLYEYRLENEKKKRVETRAGELATMRNIKKFTSLIDVFKAAIEVAWGAITSGNYKAVRRAIPEYALMAAANNLKYLPKVCNMAVRLLRALMEEALLTDEEVNRYNELIDELEIHDANARSVRGLPSESDLNDIIRPIDVAEYEDAANKKNNPTPIDN